MVYGNVAGSILAFFLFNAGVIALISPLDVGTSTLRFYLPAAAGVVVLVSAFLLTRRLPRWAGIVLAAAYLAFVAGGYPLWRPAHRRMSTVTEDLDGAGVPAAGAVR